MDPKVIFDVSKFIYDLLTSKTPFDTFKIVLTKAYFEVVEKETQCQEITQDFIENILKNPKYSYSEEKIFETKNIKDNEFFLYLHTEVKKECPEISDSYIEENIQLAVESELYYNKDNLNIKGLQDYLKSSLSEERKKLILKRVYQEKLSELYYKNNLSENFIEPSFENGYGNIIDLMKDIEQNKILFILGEKHQGKTSIAYKILYLYHNKKYYIEFDKLILPNEPVNKNYLNAIQEQISDEVGISSQEIEFSKDNLLIIDDFSKIEYLESFIDFMTKTYYKFVVLLPNLPDIKTKIDNLPFRVIDQYDNSIEIKTESTYFKQLYLENKDFNENISYFNELFKKLSTQQQSSLKKLSFNNYLKNKTTFFEQFYISYKFQEYLASLHIFELLEKKDGNQDDIMKFFSVKNISDIIIFAFTKQDNKRGLRKKIFNLLINILKGKDFSILEDIRFETLHQFYAYWSLLNSFENETKNYFDEDELEEQYQINLVYLVKLYKSIYINQKLIFNNQNFSKLSDIEIGNLFNNINFTNISFIECDFSELILDKAYFSNSRFSKCILKNTNFYRCLLDNIDFSESSVENIIFSTSNFPCKFKINESFLKSFKSIAEITFESIDLSGIDFRTLKSLTGFSFKKCDLTDCIFDHDLSNIDFSESNLTNAEFHNSIFSNTDFTGADLSYVSIDNIKIKGNIFLYKTKGLDTLKDEMKTKEAS